MSASGHLQTSAESDGMSASHSEADVTWWCEPAPGSRVRKGRPAPNT